MPSPSGSGSALSPGGGSVLEGLTSPSPAPSICLLQVLVVSVLRAATGCVCIESSNGCMVVMRFVDCRHAGLYVHWDAYIGCIHRIVYALCAYNTAYTFTNNTGV